MKTITSYHCPDLDGVACMIAYGSLLKKLGEPSQGVYTGELNLETEFVRDYTGYFNLKNIKSFKDIQDIILVDVADTNDLDESFNPDNVIEIIDHHKVNHAEKFVNAVVDIQMVGSCATLVWERMVLEKFIPTKQISIYLYSAIISNTINLKSKLTTDRDVIAASELLQKAELDEDYVRRMFTHKSKIDKHNLKQVLLQDVAIKDYRDKKISIFQLEIADMGKLVENNRELINEVIKEVKQEYKLDYIMFNGIDILNGYNIVFSADKDSSEFFGCAFGNANLMSPHKTPNIVMRKEIWSILEDI